MLLNRLILFTLGNDHLREVFVHTMGLEDIDIVTLSGGHTLVSVIAFIIFVFNFLFDNQIFLVNWEFGC